MGLQNSRSVSPTLTVRPRESQSRALYSTYHPQPDPENPPHEATLHPDATLAELYDPDLMPRALRKAHQAIDRAVDRLYRRARFTSERERVEHLFKLYEKMQAPLHAEMQPKPKHRRRRARGPDGSTSPRPTTAAPVGC